jgi:hypothetical protein
MSGKYPQWSLRQKSALCTVWLLLSLHPPHHVSRVPRPRSQGAPQRAQEHISALAAEFGKPEPDFASLSQARLNLTKASRRRALLIDQLVHAVAPAQKPTFTSLQQKLQKARLASANHISRWTFGCIEADWHGYRDASGRMREAMDRQIVEEAEAISKLQM